MEPPSPYRILFLNDSGRMLRSEPLRRVLAAALREHSFSAGELSIRLASDEEVRRLNREFRGIDRVTDVLTFPVDADFPTGSVAPLGDIAIAEGRARKQAEARGIDFETEVAYLGLHGVLHLAGFDDETEADRETMIAEMDRLGVLTGLPRVEDWHTLEEEVPA